MLLSLTGYLHNRLTDHRVDSMVSRPALMKRLRKGFDPDLWQSPQGDWREGLLSLLLRVILFLAPWVYFPSLYMCYVGGYGFIALTDTIAIVGFVCLYYFRGISFTAKAFGFALKFGLLWMSVRCSHSLACRFFANSVRRARRRRDRGCISAASCRYGACTRSLRN